jgi:hypothetical protein
MMNRAQLLRQLGKPAKPLRRRVPPRNTSDTGLLGFGSRVGAPHSEANLCLSYTNLAAGGRGGGAAQVRPLVPQRSSGARGPQRLPQGVAACLPHATEQHVQACE